MNKTVWKLAPFECFEVDAIADWLDELSRNGLQFRDKWGPFCRFERSPSPARYRVDPGRIALDPTEEERISTYRHFGWEFCSCYTQHAEVYRAEDPDTPELHTDHDLLDDLVKRTICNRLGRCLAFAIPTLQLLRLTSYAFTEWVNQQYDSYWLPLLLICALSLLMLLLTVVWIVAAALQYKYRPETMIHTTRRAKRGAFQRGLLAILLILCIVGWLWSLGTLFH